MPYEVETENFKGPLHALLELIKEKKCEITSINLAKITGDFLEYLKIVENNEPRLLADFIAVAAKLVLIKSKSLIPDLELSPEEEEGIRDLEARLKLYKELKEAEEKLAALWAANRVSFTKDPSLLERNSIFIPSPEISASSLLASIASRVSSIVALKTQYETYEAVDFEAYFTELIERVNQVSRFASVTENRNKKEVIILFLALLHLLKDNKVSVSQDSPFSEITISTLPPDRRPRVVRRTEDSSKNEQN